jgi:hypothetical protein
VNRTHPVTVSARSISTLLDLVPTLAIAGIALATASPALARSQRVLEGVVEGDGGPQAGYEVRLYATYSTGQPFEVLGVDTTDGAGRFSIAYKVPPGLARPPLSVLYVLAEKDSAMLASAIGQVEDGAQIVVNERTTVAMGASFAQFVDERDVSGNAWGVSNAVRMAANMADPETGAIGAVLANPPNAGETRTLRTFNTLANIVASCVAVATDCDLLFLYATPPGGPEPTTVLQALANITRHPSNNVPELFALGDSGVHIPILPEIPTSWLLFIKFTGDLSSEYNSDNLMSGPGNVAFDERGFAWINDNYVPSGNDVTSCAGLRLLKFHPWGEPFPGSPYFGGGLSGAGFGISIDPRGRIWVGNFGFQAPACDMLDDPVNKVPATHDSVSVFRPDGSPISPFEGFTNGRVWWPQATVSDPKGNIWIANCGNDTVTVVPRGKPDKAMNVALPAGQGEMGNFRVFLPDEPELKPFAVAIDPLGRAYVTGNHAGYVSDTDPGGPEPAGRVYRISPDGGVETLPHTDANGDPVLSWPMGVSGDSHGNMWVSNSDSVNVPCVTPLERREGTDPSVTLYRADGSPPEKYGGGGLVIPWGNAVDGADTLWVFNFGTNPFVIVEEDTAWPDTSLVRFCGVDESQCPAGKHTGDPISPPRGYVSDALDRITGGGVDPSGNVWLLNNWKRAGPYDPIYQTNPGGNSIVIVPGAAAPVRTPVLGPPMAF